MKVIYNIFWTVVGAIVWAVVELLDEIYYAWGSL